MEVEPSTSFDWANDAFVALNDPALPSTTDKWTAFNRSSPASFGIPPALLTQSSIERYGQVTPPEELSPNSGVGRSNDVPWPGHDQIQALANYQPSPEQAPAPQQQQTPQPSSPKRRRTTRASLANQKQASPHPGEGVPAVNPQPAKRKRGRPKSQPQPSLAAFDHDGLPFQVSSARQMHLEKNRVAAHKCRQRKKEYINSLETRAREFSSRNKQLKENIALLREEVLELKNEVLRHAGCGFWAVDEYLARCAGDLLGVDGRERMMSMSKSMSRHDSRHAPSPSLSTASELHGHADMLSDKKINREASQESLPSQGTMGTPSEWVDLGLLKDIDEDMAEEDA